MLCLILLFIYVFVVWFFFQYIFFLKGYSWFQLNIYLTTEMVPQWTFPHSKSEMDPMKSHWHFKPEMDPKQTLSHFKSEMDPKWIQDFIFYYCEAPLLVVFFPCSPLLWSPSFFYYWPLHLRTFIKVFNQYPSSTLFNLIYRSLYNYTILGHHVFQLGCKV